MAVTTPSSRLLFWLKASFVLDALFGAIGGIMIGQGEGAGWALLVFAVLRAAVGVVALVITVQALERRHPGDDRPSIIR